jgi:anhydro-N-acetylmuramic acid kinase
MIAAFAAAAQGANHGLNDLLATAAYVTAATIATAIGQHAPGTQEGAEVIASGGGVNNRAIMDWVRALLGQEWTIRHSLDLGLPTDAKEAVAFALLAAATLDGLPSNVPSATGARRAVVLGSITPRP